jgi:hypothetical protein
MAALITLFAVLTPQRKGVTEELQGRWKASDEAHKDRFLEISEVTVNFGTGNGTVSTGFIHKFDETEVAGQKAYTISYSDDNGGGTLALLYDPGSKVLRLKNQQSIAWKKKMDS